LNYRQNEIDEFRCILVSLEPQVVFNWSENEAGKSALGRSARRKPRTGPARRQGALQARLVRLWQKLAAEKQAPALDRFLARELGRLDGLPRTDRLWLGDLITDGVRFGALTVFCESWRRDNTEIGVTPQERLAKHPLPAGPALWRRLTQLPVPIVFFWTFMRKRLTGTELPVIAAPGPGAAEIWKVMRETAPGSEAVAVRALWAGLPPSLQPLLQARAELSGWTAADLLGFCDRHALRPPVGLRVLQPGQLAALAAELQEAGFSVAGRSPSLAVRGSRGVYELAAYRQGVCEIQDRASQEIGDAVGVRPGQIVWDCCAGAGGKSLQLAAVMGGRGEVLATDLYDNKLQDLRKRAARANLTNIRTVVWDGLTLPDFGDAATAQGGFDRVLVDAPCSGSGTWRRNVDGRLRFETGPIANLAQVQQQLLALAAKAVRPGGQLVYATCSWLPQENEAVVAAFSAAHPRWRLLRQSLHGSPTADADTTFTGIVERPA